MVGSTEALHDFIANRPGEARGGASGKVIPGFETRLVDDDGVTVPAGTVGHLLVKGATTASGYWNRRERTRSTMLGEWLRTGDMFRQDADGWFYFEGRRRRHAEGRRPVGLAGRGRGAARRAPGGARGRA